MRTLFKKTPEAQPGLRFMMTFAIICIACSEDDSCEYAVCDIQERSCAEAAAEAVTCHMGETLSLPSIVYMSRVDLQAEIASSKAEMSETDILYDWAWHQRAQLLGLEPAGYTTEDWTAEYLETLSAFYSSLDKEIVILEGGRSGDLEDNYLLLVHELVHAVQDQRWDLATLRKKYAYTADRGLGLKSIVEGEALLTEDFAYLELNDTPIEEYPFDLLFLYRQESSWYELSTVTNPGLHIERLLPYDYGVEFVYNAWARGGRDEIDGLFETPPDSSRAVSLGYDYRLQHGPSINKDTELDQQGAPIMPSRFQSVGVSHVGVWYISIMAQETAGYASYTAWVSPRQPPFFIGIPSDVLTAFVDADTEEVVAVWRIAASDSTDALANVLLSDRLSIWKDVSLLDGEPATHVVAWSGDDLVLVATTGSDATTLFDFETDWQSVEELEAEANRQDARSAPFRIKYGANSGRGDRRSP